MYLRHANSLFPQKRYVNDDRDFTVKGYIPLKWKINRLTDRNGAGVVNGVRKSVGDVQAFKGELIQFGNGFINKDLSFLSHAQKLTYQNAFIPRESNAVNSPTTATTHKKAGALRRILGAVVETDTAFDRWTQITLLALSLGQGPRRMNIHQVIVWDIISHLEASFKAKTVIR
jgi:hypothetical protein